MTALRMECEKGYLISVEGLPVPLQSVHIQGTMRDLLATIGVEQVFRNQEKINIEAIYTFPLPLDAVLLDLTLTIGERVLTGSVVEKEASENRYENAIVNGDTVVMLQEPEPGLYTMNLGNLRAGESAAIRFSYALLHRWQGDTVRFFLPTTIAPRYGEPIRAGLDERQAPRVDPTVEHAFTLELEIQGTLQGSEISSPTHPLAIVSGETTRIRLARREAAMDRDLALLFQLAHGGRHSAIVDVDPAGYALQATFHPAFPVSKEIPYRNIKIVVDCSGSMVGDAMRQTRMALSRILETLRPQDHFNIVFFGYERRLLFPSQKAASLLNITRARMAIRKLQADMGGTEIGLALEEAYVLSGPHHFSADVLLITDGEVWEADPIIERARSSGHTIFSVGVGGSVAERFVREIAQATGGACEMVTPGEEMAERIHRHFQRIFLPRAKRVEIGWPGEPRDRTSLPAVYSGDTVHLFNRFDKQPFGRLRLQITLEDGQRLEESVDVQRISPPQEGGDNRLSIVARLGANQRLVDIQESQKAAREAVAYQLVSPFTNFLALDIGSDRNKADQLPDLRQVPSMLAAGWGGVGEVVMEACVADSPREREAWDVPTFLRKDVDAAPASPAPRVFHQSGRAPAAESGRPQDLPDWDVPTFLRKAGKEGSKSENDGAHKGQVSQPRLRSRNRIRGMSLELDRADFPPYAVMGKGRRSGKVTVRGLAELANLGIPESMIEELGALVDEGYPEWDLLVGLLFSLFVLQSAGPRRVSRAARRVIMEAHQELAHDAELTAWIEDLALAVV